MSSNWELALEHVRGEWIMFIGDDDGLLPNAFQQLDRVIATIPSRLICWETAYYIWPTPALPEDSDYLRVPLGRNYKLRRCHELIKQAGVLKVPFYELPNCYHCLVHRSVLEEVRKLTKKVFRGTCPDVYTGFAFAALEQICVSLAYPISIVGHSSRSNGGASLRGENPNAEFIQLNEKEQFPQHPWSTLDVPLGFVFDAYLLAQELIFPHVKELHLERTEVIKGLIKACNPGSPEQWQLQRGRIRKTLDDDPSLQAWFDDYVSRLNLDEFIKPPPPKPIVKEWGYRGDALHVDGARFGIKNIAEAAAFCDYVLGLTDQRHPANWPSRESLLSVPDKGRLARLKLPKPMIRAIRGVLTLMGKRYGDSSASQN
jgi:hypothetical protein